ncbi:MAG TPA: glycosyltransferase family 39 protein, partial [Flavobacterium sp.]
MDEVLSMNDVNPKNTFRQFYESVLFWEAFPHLYFLLLKYWVYCFGFTSMAARVLSAVIGVAGVYSMYLLGKELYNKRCGLIVAALTAINIYHIYYSQEVRPYGLLFFFSVLSFYRMAILIRNPNYKNAIIYGVFTGLMVNAHFFGLLTIFAQSMILLFFLFNTNPDEQKRFFLFLLAAAVVTIILILPTYQALLQISQIKTIWINKPAPDSFTLMFKEFFGNSELLLFIFNVLLMYYFIILFKTRLANRSNEAILGNKMIFTFIIFVSWIFISLLVPIIKSYLDVSMILTRYFINILPALLLVVVIGIELIRSQIVRNSVIAIIVIFSLVELFVIKDYYNTPTKSEYKELTAGIKQRNKENVKIVTFWSWIFPYYFQDNPSQKFEHAENLEEYVGKMITRSVPIKSFWYADSNGRPIVLSENAQKFMDENFFLKHKLERMDAWANYYVSRRPEEVVINEPIDLSLFKNATFDGTGNLIFIMNSTAIAPAISLEPGNYELAIKGNSLPAKPINGENAHLIAK